MEIKIRCDKPIQMIPIEEIIPDPRNPNTHPPEQIELLTKNIEYQGWRHPIIISNRTGTMISGEGRTMAARALGMAKVPASFQDYDDETQEIFSIIAENELDKRSIIDQKKEADLMLEVDAGDFDMELTGKFEYEIENQMTAVHLEEIEEDKFNVEKEYNEIEKAEAKRGNIYTLGNHRLMCGDATNPEDVAKLTNGALIDMVFTDPPYNVAYSSRGQKLNDQENNSILNDDMSEDEFLKFNEAWMRKMQTNCKSGAVLYICSGWRSATAFITMLRALEIHVSNLIIWIKNNVTMGWDDYRRKHESVIKAQNAGKKKTSRPIIYGWLKGPHYFREVRDEADVWEISRRATNKMIHPTQKPLKLVLRAVINSSHRHDKILDLFGGGGSTLIVCEKTKRSAYIMELDPKFIDLQIKRWEEYTGQTAALQQSEVKE